jgi:hypothetical protein
MAVNKVIINDETVVDLTDDTVTPEKLASGVTAHDKSGNIITGLAAEMEALTDEEIIEAIGGSLGDGNEPDQGTTGGGYYTPSVTKSDENTAIFSFAPNKSGMDAIPDVTVTLPRGKNGEDGVSVTHSWNGTRLTISSASGTSSVDLKGETGADGQPGRTPVKGTDYFTDSDKEALVNEVVSQLGDSSGDNIYPGYIYISADSTSPASLFGGRWERVEDVFLLAAGSNYEAGSTGGEVTHTLTEDEMPSHKHTLASFVSYRGGNSSNASSQTASGTGAYFVKDAGTAITATGGSQPHNNMPPYLTVYMWIYIGE